MKKFIPILVYLTILPGCITVHAPEKTAEIENSAPQTEDLEQIGNDNTAPVIIGTPAQSVEVNTFYSFKPSSSDADNDQLNFKITNKPSWATFNTDTGELYGNPEVTGMNENIEISVSDGVSQTYLNAFEINVTLPTTYNVNISWEKPSQNTDGSALNNISGYEIMYGNSEEHKDNTVYFDGAVTDGIIEDLLPGNYYFSMTTITSNALVSNESETFYFNVTN